MERTYYMDLMFPRTCWLVSSVREKKKTQNYIKVNNHPKILISMAVFKV